jgi:hypothetical protein
MNFQELYFKEDENTFTIPEKIKKNYKITDSFKDIKSWTAKIYLNNSMGDKLKVGAYQNVGYVMIAINSNNIIPIARNDEHQNGYELLEHLVNKKLIKDEEYVAVYLLTQDYIYSNYKEDLDKKLIAYKKLLTWGSRDITISDSNSNYLGTMSDIVKKKGNVKIQKGMLAPIGRKLVDRLEELAKEYKKTLTSTREKDFEKLNDAAIDFLDDFSYPLSLDLDVKTFGEIKLLKDELLKNFSNNSYMGTVFFSHDGIKNTIHMNIKKYIKDSKNYNQKDYIKVFGDLEKANNEFNRLGQI